MDNRGTFLTQDDVVRDLFLRTINALTGPDASVTIDIQENGSYSTLHVVVTAEALSILVGSKGQMARALRIILAGLSARLGKRYALDLSGTDLTGTKRQPEG